MIPFRKDRHETLASSYAYNKRTKYVVTHFITDSVMQCVTTSVPVGCRRAKSCYTLRSTSTPDRTQSLTRCLRLCSPNWPNWDCHTVSHLLFGRERGVNSWHAENVSSCPWCLIVSQQLTETYLLAVVDSSLYYSLIWQYTTAKYGCKTFDGSDDTPENLGSFKTDTEWKVLVQCFKNVKM